MRHLILLISLLLTLFLISCEGFLGSGKKSYSSYLEYKGIQYELQDTLHCSSGLLDIETYRYLTLIQLMSPIASPETAGLIIEVFGVLGGDAMLPDTVWLSKELELNPFDSTNRSSFRIGSNHEYYNHLAKADIFVDFNNESVFFDLKGVMDSGDSIKAIVDGVFKFYSK